MGTEFAGDAGRGSLHWRAVWLLLVLASCPGPFAEDRAGFALGQGAGLGLTDAGLVVLPDAGPTARSRAVGLSGRFTSRVVDLGVRAFPLQVDLSTLAPAGAPLPVNGGADPGFAVGGVSMQQNALLVPFEEPAGVSTVLDRSANARVGRLDGGITFGVPGLVGRAARFDGGCLVFDSSPTFDPGPTLSIAAWIRPTGLNGVDPHGLVSRRDDFMAASQFTFFLWLNNQLWVDLESENDRFSGTRSIPNDVWTHVALVYDGRLDAGARARVYVDGQLDAVSTETSASLPSRTIPVVLGCLPNPSGGLTQAYDGDMDEVALFTRALSEAEVASVYARGASQHRVALRTCDEPLCADAGAFGPVTPGSRLSLPETRYLQYQVEADAPANKLGWSTVTGVQVQLDCPRQPDAGVVDAGAVTPDAGVVDAGSMDAPDASVRDAGLAPIAEARRLEVGCGCTGVEGSFAWLLLGVMERIRRRRLSG